ncbi:tRNA pseudouridine synthase D [Caulifigura coniformis]|uniref:tRNA pseudouridine synthase D n=1 Tax=Caulifigura coniformis TaxID=2527983 RepID=A0A517S9M8_9PLAN|nr:tRNA pseudouridine(13) synthase TruD [Caulifigura coniformis]QDT52824.1 tRNA pseudouridine synthase D [Caulifigura coniformis]
MKLRRVPEDFFVEEISDFPIGREGSHAVYRLTKTGLGTLEAVDAIIQRWKIERQKMSWGGLKDRHAVTGQFLTIFRGPKRDLEQNNLHLEYLGQAHQPFTAADIQANRFSLVLRSLGDDDVAFAETALGEVQKSGLPNYFDDQRFGSMSAAGEFIARPWIEGNYERTLWLTFAEPHPFDRSDEKVEKQILRDHWGDWLTCKAKLARSHRRSVVTYLCDKPTDFRGAWARVKVDLRSLYLSAYQSYLWNEMAAEYLRQNCPAESLIDVALKTGPVPFFGQLPDDIRLKLQQSSLPLPSARQKLDPGPTAQLVDETLSKHSLELRQIRVKYPRDSFFSKGWRKTAIRADGLSWSAGDDEMANGRRRMTLDFTLPRGSYATILIKRITVAGRPVEDEEPNPSADDADASMAEP